MENKLKDRVVLFSEVYKLVVGDILDGVKVE